MTPKRISTSYYQYACLQRYIVMVYGYKACLRLTMRKTSYYLIPCQKDFSYDMYPPMQSKVIAIVIYSCKLGWLDV